MKILLIGSGAREHAIADALSRSRHKPEIIAFCTTRNLGIEALASHMEVGDIMDFSRLRDRAKDAQPDFAFIGPDDPIGAGAADALKELGIESVAPRKQLAQIESSKGFTRNLMEKHGIDASPRFRVFTRGTDSVGALAEERKILEQYISKELRGDFVVKYDALKGGKGVKVSGEHLKDVEEGVQYAVECLHECGRVVIEEKLEGVEFSLLSFVSGTKVADMPAVQDHKRAHEGDTGPNTGGMGTYSDADHGLPFLTPEDLSKAKEINRRIADALLLECEQPYRGILYGGFMAVKDGIRVIEYNARFGDPEALNLLPLLVSDFVEICQAIINGELTEEMVKFSRKATVCKYITPQSYPGAKSEKGKTFTLPGSIPSDVRIFFGDVSRDDAGALHLGGSRAVGIVGIGNTIAEAERAAQSVCQEVRGPVRYRRDIGAKKLIDRRLSLLQKIRS